MNMFQFAIASIVDANTGNGLIHSSGKLDYAAAESHARVIRAKSISDLLASIRSRLVEIASRYRVAAKQRRELRVLMTLNDHLLDDIGLSRGDLHAVRLGAVTLDELHARYRSARSSGQVQRNELTAGETVKIELDAINEQFFDARKCA